MKNQVNPRCEVQCFLSDVDRHEIQRIIRKSVKYIHLLITSRQVATRADATWQKTSDTNWLRRGKLHESSSWSKWENPLKRTRSDLTGRQRSTQSTSRSKEIITWREFTSLVWRLPHSGVRYRGRMIGNNPEYSCKSLIWWSYTSRHPSMKSAHVV